MLFPLPFRLVAQNYSHSHGNPIGIPWEWEFPFSCTPLVSSIDAVSNDAEWDARNVTYGRWTDACDRQAMIMMRLIVDADELTVSWSWSERQAGTQTFVCKDSQIAVDPPYSCQINAADDAVVECNDLLVSHELTSSEYAVTDCYWSNAFITSCYCISCTLDVSNWWEFPQVPWVQRYSHGNENE